MKTVYTITPSWLITKQKDLTDGVKNLEKLGFKVLNKGFVSKLPSPREKARQLHRAFRDKTIDFVLAQRGGYSSMKMLPYVDFDLIGKNPKLFGGFSDLSTLLNAVYERTGLITLHSPMVINLSEPTGFTVRSFMNAV
ncbi:MAG: LD-carboxypeptidase, partial [Endomicrobiales bacterium]